LTISWRQGTGAGHRSRSGRRSLLADPM